MFYLIVSRRSVLDVQRNGKICVLDVEIEGVRNLKRTHLNARYVFIKPPTVEILVSAKCLPLVNCCNLITVILIMVLCQLQKKQSNAMLSIV